MVTLIKFMGYRLKKQLSAVAFQNVTQLVDIVNLKMSLKRLFEVFVAHHLSKICQQMNQQSSVLDNTGISFDLDTNQVIAISQLSRTILPNQIAREYLILSKKQ
jgi:hypothetical protein